MTILKAEAALRHVSCFSVDESSGICHIEYTDQTECYKPLCECADIVLAFRVLHHASSREIIRICRTAALR